MTKQQKVVYLKSEIEWATRSIDCAVSPSTKDTLNSLIKQATVSLNILTNGS